MNARAIMFAVLGVILVGGLTSWSVMKDMRRIRAENAQKAATTPAATQGQQGVVPADGADPNQQQYQQGSTTDQYGSQGYDQQQGYSEDPGYDTGQSQGYPQEPAQGYGEDPGYSGGQSQEYGQDPGYSSGGSYDQSGAQSSDSQMAPS